MRAQERLTAVALCLLVLAGCAAELAGDRLREYSRLSSGALLPVERKDFPDGDPRRGSPSVPGSAMLRDASIADDGVAGFVRRHGLPDGIALHSMALEIQLAYVGEGKLYVLRHTALEAVTPRAWNSSSLASERKLSEAEIDLLDPERRMARRVESTRVYIDAYARVHSVGRKVLLALPTEAAGEPGYDFGFLSTRVNDVTTRLFDLPADSRGILVASVDPEGPSAAALQAGDLIVEIDGQPIGGGSKSAAPPGQARHVKVVRAGKERELALAPETWPWRVVFVTLDSPEPNAFAVEGAVAVTTGLLALLKSDDELAAAIGHELGHITLGHVEPKVTVGGVIKGILGLGVLVPAEIALPGSGQLIGALVQGVSNRFNRDQERDADRLGVRYAAAAGYDPRGMLILIDQLQKEAPVGAMAQFFSSHPPYPERRDIVSQEIAALP